MLLTGSYYPSLKFLQIRKIVLMAIQDDGSKYVKPALHAFLRRVRGRPYRIGFRGSFAFVGFYGRGRRPRWVRQVTRPRRKGPSQLSVNIRLPKLRRGKRFYPFVI